MQRILLIFVLIYSTISQAGEPTEEELRATTQFYMEAAKKGDASAQLMVSQAYWNGWGLSRHEDISMRWLKKSVAQDYPPAIFDLGYRTLYGTGVPKNTEEALSILERASEMGNTDAKVLLGSYYLNLTFDHKIIDAKKGEKYLLSAVEHGDSNGMLQLGMMYMYGLEPGANLDANIQKDKVKFWLTGAAEELNLNAMLALAEFYSDRSHQNLDPESAYFWLYAVKQLTGNIPDGLARFELALSAATRSKVHDRVAGWIEKYNKQRQPTL
ncbi:tetratricopeptide repeat protein [Spongiibacter tropicus]|uniref:tetratricopeptide repeat protein n=1 Tax=Spongiibacter tropicus TaxID=454602 RepID=UPI0003B37D67|nr:tetratricopeptide repeat protein [Spongiibacter tropicus]